MLVEVAPFWPERSLIQGGLGLLLLSGAIFLRRSCYNTQTASPQRSADMRRRCAMPLPLFALMVLVGLVLVGACYGLWRYWERQANVSPEEEAYDRRVALLNQRQANRLSDEQLREPPREQDAWELMVQRGRRAAQRRDRYAGNLQRRARERRRPE